MSRALPEDQPGLGRQLQAVMDAAWSCAESASLGEWRLRWAWGISRRANSVLVSGDPGTALASAVDGAEGFYRDRGLPPCFQLWESSAPAALREELERRGYTGDVAATDVLAAPLSSLGEAPGGGQVDGGWSCDEDEEASPDWWSVYAGVSRHRAPAGRDVARAHLETLLRPRAAAVFVTAHRAGEPAAVGQGVAQDRWLAVQGVATRPEHRRRGGARAVLRALGTWGSRHGCTHACLAVVGSNQPAQALYRRMGFAAVDRYAYWVAPWAADDGARPQV
jgi:ribosomal protein S18 acetylase RimI-like enzyme